MKNFFKEFKEFAVRGSVIDLAVGVIIGAAFQAIVNSLVNDILSPLIGIFIGGNFDSLYVMINSTKVMYGAFIMAIINFIIMALVIFLIVKGLNKLFTIGKKKGGPEPAPITKKCPYCFTDIPVQATRCPNCTAALPKA